MKLKDIVLGAGIALSTMFGCGPELKNEVNVCRGVLMPKYEQYLVENQNVASSLVWDGSTKLQYAEDCRAMEDLEKAIDGRIELIEPPVATEYDEENDRAFFNEEDAWKMYLLHVAHSLKLEVNNSLPWKLKDLKREDVGLILDGRNFIVRDNDLYKDNELYTFDEYDANARIGLTDWSPVPVFDFMIKNDLIGSSEEETLYRVTEWMSKNLHHIYLGVSNDWDNYKGKPPVDVVLNSIEHWTEGCWGTTSLYMAMMHAVNVPVRRGYTLFSTMNSDYIGVHSRPEFPTLNKALAHGDDPYTREVKGSYHKIPAEELFLTFDELKTLVDDPVIKEVNGYLPTKPEQASFNVDRWMLELAVKHKTDYLLYLRAFEALGGYNPYDGNLEELLTGTNYDDKLQKRVPRYWVDLFDKNERDQIINDIDEELKKLGDGDYMKGCQIASTFIYSF